ncbi:MAG: pyruvate, water dikinase [Desulfobacterales bacterium]|jgi:pyruvate,water dikinase|nr:pyruvate, water dikinase [Desulfobacterales bacterium]
MSALLNHFKKLFIKKPEPAAGDVEQLRIEFKERYHSFKLLLNANNRALEIMADMERVLESGQPFGMAFVRASCTAVSVNVFNMIKHIGNLSKGRYGELDKRFNEIRQKMDELLSQKKSMKDKRLVIPIDAVSMEMRDVVGSKMANLGEIKNRLQIKIPEGFVITAAACERVIQDNDLQMEIDRLFQSDEGDNVERRYALSSKIQQLIIRSRIPDDVAEAVRRAYARLESDAKGKVALALRSSALGEDMPESSFAGQYRSELNVGFDSIFQAYKEILASKYSFQAVTYRLNRGIKDEDIAMCVGCLRMVDAVAGGVAYTRNPVDIADDAMFINSAWGLPKSVVDGSDAYDLFVVSKKPAGKIIRKEVNTKKIKFVCLPEEGVCQTGLTGDQMDLPSIDDKKALELSELAARIEEYYAIPQDIEWAVDKDDAIYILQCRPLKQIKPLKTDLPEPEFTRSHNAVIAGQGVTASPGAASGKVFLVDKTMDLLQFPQGAIMVARQALPIWSSLLNRSAAVITEQGGFAGHLASVAREFGVPALFGVPGAMDRLNHGEQVTVDADTLTIYKGEIKSLSTKSGPKMNLMQGSPVYETLKRVSRLIIPLNLLDPDSPYFRPVNCKTLHDITRFIHEKAVIEMFNFGKAHNFSEKSSKQLYYNVPMQWWILNLDDGFKKEISGKYVTLENIASIPMLAFWKGFSAVAWEGPPAIDGKGFASVVFQSTTNRNLIPGLRSAYGARNYFMISKNYCSLSSRLGYHFSIMEALVSERLTENYISFQFKGGAADHQRRLGRVHLIAEILQKQGFRVDIREDNLIARVEGHDMEYMKNRLEILGYLTLHTRQLDMIMSNNAALNHYQQKLEKDICNILDSK